MAKWYRSRQLKKLKTWAQVSVCSAHKGKERVTMSSWTTKTVAFVRSRSKQEDDT